MAPDQPVAADLIAGLPEPTPAAIKAARGKLTQAEFAALVGAGRDACAKWEAGERSMPASTWALALLATGQHPGAAVTAR